jgi:hypothetical protein
MEQFTLSLNFKPNQQQCVLCLEKDLFMRAVNPEFNDLDLLDNKLYFAAYYDLNNFTNVIFFEVLFPELDLGFKKWSKQLFIDAILYYSKKIIGREPELLNCINRENLMPYEKQIVN